MKNKAKRIVSAVCALAMCAALVPAAAFAEPVSAGDGANSAVTWEVSKSKTATNLDDNYESNVTLSLPAADYEPVVDVVLVMDISSSMKEADMVEAKDAAKAMCDELAAKDNVDVNVGIVTFDKTAHDVTGGLVSVDEAKAAVDEIKASSDTNMMAGLIAGKEMLDAGTADADSKYLVLMSDGIPIYWMENGQPVSKTLFRYDKDKVTVNSKMPAGAEPEASSGTMEDMMSMEDILAISDMDSDSNDWNQVSDTGEDINPACKYTNIQKATYMTAKYLQSDILGKYKLKMVAFGTDKYENNVVYKYGENFCDWIGAQAGVDYYKVAKPGFGGETGQLTEAFSEIANDLVYLLDAGSKVKDVIGYGNDYNMDFQADLSKLELTVNGTALDKVELTVSNANETACYGFGADAALEAGYKFVLHYYAKGEDGASDECLVWDINVPVSIEAPVQLTYTVKLTNPQTEPGTYGAYDADGSKGYDGLLTNMSATLYPVDSTGAAGQPEEFAKPTVSYTVNMPSTPLNPLPTKDDLNTLLDVQVLCVNTQVSHAAVTFENLLDGSYKVVGNTDGSAVVTVDKSQYVEGYDANAKTGFTHTATATCPDFYSYTLNYNAENDSWTFSDGTTSRTISFQVECKVEPTATPTTTTTATPAPSAAPTAAPTATPAAPTATPAAANTIPQTSDELPLGMLIVVAIVAAGAVGGLVVLRKRREQ